MRSNFSIIFEIFQSGKSALVHRYLTGSYVNDESPEGGRFKKEVNVEGILLSFLSETIILSYANN